jgi:RNA-directed DNA polymerase
MLQTNRGAAGVNGQTFEDIEEYGVKKWLDELTQELKSRTYQPQPVRRAFTATSGVGETPAS